MRNFPQAGRPVLRVRDTALDEIQDLLLAMGQVHGANIGTFLGRCHVFFCDFDFLNREGLNGASEFLDLRAVVKIHQRRAQKFNNSGELRPCLLIANGKEQYILPTRTKQQHA